MNKKWLPGLIGLSIFALLGRLLGFVREALMASKFGANGITDAYLTTLLLFDIAIAANMSILSGTLSYVSGIKNLSENRPPLFRTGMQAFAVMLLAAIIYYPLAEPIAGSIFGRSSDILYIIIDSSRLLMFLSAFLIGSGVFSASLQLDGKTTVPGRLIVFLNLSSILMIILFAKKFGIIALPFGLLVGGILFFFYQITLIGVKERNIAKVKENKLNFNAWGVVVFLIFCNSLLPSLSGFIERYFAVFFNPGTFSHYQYAAKIMLLPLTIFSFAISTSLLPLQSRSVSSGNEKEFAEITNKSILLSVLSSGYFVLIFSVAAEAIVRIVYQRGHFAQQDSLETATALRIMSAGLIPFLLNPVLANVFYLKKSSRLIISINLFFIFLQAGLLFLFSRIIPGVVTFAAAWVIFVWTNNGALIWFLYKKMNVRIESYLSGKLLMILMSSLIFSLGVRWLLTSMHLFSGTGETGWILLYKAVLIGIALMFLYAGIVFYVFRARLTGIWTKLKNR